MSVQSPSPRTDAAHFERLYQDSPDPWDYRSSEYERHKYARTLAALPRPTYSLALEVGCSIGVFTGLLAVRCEHLVAVDFSLRALALARRNLRETPNVDLVRASFPEDTPPGSWELVVCSEVLYYLQAAALEEAIGWITAQLQGGTCVVAVSWRGHGTLEPLRGDDVHDRLATELEAWHALDRRDAGYRLDRFDGHAR